MKLPNRIIERATNAILILLFLAVTATSCFSQDDTVAGPASTNGSTTKGFFNLAHNLNLSGKAVPLSSNINSPYLELKPTLAPDGTRLYFSRSEHPDNTAGEKDKEDIWYSNYNKKLDIWSDPIRMSGALNNGGPNYINNVSTTGDTLVLGNRYGKKGKMFAGLSYSVNVEGRWSNPVSIDVLHDYNLSTHANTHVSFGAGVIIKAVERAESYGRRDLYVSFWSGGKGTEPVNMGDVINTDLEESSPFLSADTRSLYFASKGHHGYGGSDIFVTRRLDDSWTSWSEPANLGPAINGPLDEEYFSITHCGTYATFSKQTGKNNVDLYKIAIGELFVIPAPKKSEQLMVSHSPLLSL